MPIDAYPTVENGGPPPLKLRDFDPDWEPLITRQQFEDGGEDYNRESDTPIYRWEIVYDGLTEAEVAILDEHRGLAKGISESFTFVHPRSGTSYSGVRYEAYERDHSKRWIQSRRVVLIKRP